MNENKTVSFIEFEAAGARSERKFRQLLTALIITVGLMFASNLVWLWVFWGRFIK